MKRKLGRNDPCWCGSGLKYKYCHLGREREEPLSIGQVAQAQRKAFSAKYCLAPETMKADCSGTIVKAHTVPKRGSLQKIARNGHVYSFIPSLENLIKYEGRLQPELTGINRASTFTGFCSRHDNQIFSQIEDQPFENSQEHCFLLAYRSLVREIYGKKALISLSDMRSKADYGKSEAEQIIIQHNNQLLNLGASLGLKNSEYHKGIYDEVLTSQDFSHVRAYIIELESPAPIMCSGGLFPEQDFEGNQLQDLNNFEMIPHLINYTSFCNEDRGLIVFTWLPGSNQTCKQFIDSLRKLETDRVTDALMRFLFEFCENIHIKPDWWENLSGNKKDALIDRLTSSANPCVARKPGCIAEDNIKFDIWPISYRKTIGY